ncbi:MFS transporter [Novispirillum itersonii]|uniref:MFS transporter n=1 Tax=Novispirillum itersonii TaxID=189 RepID=UPI0005C21842|nr:MFS transporter [Novispirillum itersonii]
MTPVNHAVGVRLPLSGLLALASAGFITTLTEALPAGLLPQIGAGLGVPDALAGQLVTAYAVGSLLAAVPLMMATQSLRRRPLLLTAVVGFVIANTITAVSTRYGLTMVARFIAGASAGLLWALLAGYAARMAPDSLKGRAIAIAMAGTPLALSLGIPAGVFIGSVIGWRACFVGISGMTLILIVWILAKVPDFSGQAPDRRASLFGVLGRAGVRPVLFVTLAFVLAHNILYTYIAPFLSAVRLENRTDHVLLLFGVMSLMGIWGVGVLIDRRLRGLTLVSTALFALAALALWMGQGSPLVLYGAVAVWGLSFGGAATLFQTALARASGDAADVAQSMLVTVWNVAIAGGGLAGGLLLETVGAATFPVALLGLLVPALTVVWCARRHGFSASSL